MNDNRLIGGWLLQSWSITADGKRSFPYGESASGQLMYTADGYMSAIICNAECPPIPEGSLRKLNDSQKAALVDHSFAYGGRWEMVRDKEQDIVLHHVEVSQNPNFVGSVQRRHARFEGNQLTLSAEEALANGSTRLHALVWRRDSKHQ